MVFVIPANKILISRTGVNEEGYSFCNDDDNFVNPSKQFADYPFDVETRRFCKIMFKEAFQLIQSEGEAQVRVIKPIVFGDNQTRIDIFLVGIYYQGDISHSCVCSYLNYFFLFQLIRGSLDKRRLRNLDKFSLCR